MVFVVSESKSSIRTNYVCGAFRDDDFDVPERGGGAWQRHHISSRIKHSLFAAAIKKNTSISKGRVSCENDQGGVVQVLWQTDCIDRWAVPGLFLTQSFNAGYGG